MPAWPDAYSSSLLAALPSCIPGAEQDGPLPVTCKALHPSMSVGKGLWASCSVVLIVSYNLFWEKHGPQSQTWIQIPTARLTQAV